jgi:uncharacterized protein
MNTASFILTLSLILNCSFLRANFESGFEPWGFDKELSRPALNKLTNEVKKKSAAQKGCISCIHFFQDYISPIDGPRSTFYPTSSQYTLEAIEKYGIFKGIALGCDRLMRENEEMWVYDVVDKYGHKRKLDPVR